MDTLFIQFWGFEASASGTLGIAALAVIILALLLSPWLRR